MVKPAHRRRRGAARALLRLGVAAMIAGAAWIAGLFWFATLIPDGAADESIRTDAIAVLTGGSGRLGTGLELLARNRAEKLFVSGVYRGVDVKKLLEVAKRSPDGIEGRVGIGDAIDTAGNAAETAAWVRAQGYRSLRIVTSAYHMPRSLLEFQRALPEAELIPHPVFPKHVKQDRWWAWPGTASLIVSEYNKYLIAWARHAVKGPPAATQSPARKP